MQLHAPLVTFCVGIVWSYSLYQLGSITIQRYRGIYIFCEVFFVYACSHVLLTLVTSFNFFIYYFKHGNFCKQNKSNHHSVTTNASMKTTATRTRTGTVVTRSGNYGSGVAVAAVVVQTEVPPDTNNCTANNEKGESPKVKVEFDMEISPLGPQHNKREPSCCTRI